jgi:phospholipid:diacylglycerol acyltransferase
LASAVCFPSVRICRNLLPQKTDLSSKGGDTIWGNSVGAPDDADNQLISYGRFINFRETLNSSSGHSQNLTVGETLPYLLDSSEPWYANAIRTNYSQGIAHSEAEVEENQLIPHKWMNPLETRLPKAPSMKIYCFYGVGKPTERAYFYREDLDPLTLTNVTIDTSYSPPSSDVGGLNIDHGVIMGEGDGTVSLLSTGYMCNRGWRLKQYNPAGVRITTVEMAHEPDRFSPRGGPNTADHVDVLGRSSLNDLILRVAGGRGEEIQEQVVSRIREYAEKVEISGEEVDVRRGMGGGFKEQGGEVVNVTDTAEVVEGQHAVSEDERREHVVHGEEARLGGEPQMVDEPRLVEEVHLEVVHEET